MASRFKIYSCLDGLITVSHPCQLNMVDMLLFSAGMLFLIPFFIQLRLYFLLRVRTYAIFSLIFLSAFVDSMISSFDPQPFEYQILLSLSFVTIYLIIIYISYDAIDHKLPVRFMYWVLVVVLIFIGTIGMKYLITAGVLESHFTSLRIAYGEVLEFCAGVVVWYSFSHIKLVNKTTRTLRIRRLWILIAIILLFNALSKILFHSLFFSSVQFGGNPFVSTDLLNFVEDLVTINVLIIAMITFVFALFYPETLLLSQSQFIGAYKMYTILERRGLFEDDHPRFFTEELVLEYLESLSHDYEDTDR